MAGCSQHAALTVGRIQGRSRYLRDPKLDVAPAIPDGRTLPNRDHARPKRSRRFSSGLVWPAPSGPAQGARSSGRCQNRSRRGYSRFGDAHPRPSPNRESLQPRIDRPHILVIYSFPSKSAVSAGPAAAPTAFETDLSVTPSERSPCRSCRVLGGGSPSQRSSGIAGPQFGQRSQPLPGWLRRFEFFASASTLGKPLTWAAFRVERQ